MGKRALMGVARCIYYLYVYMVTFAGKYFVVCFSTTKILPPRNIAVIFRGGAKFSWIWTILQVCGKNFVVMCKHRYCTVTVQYPWCKRALMGVARCIYNLYVYKIMVTFAGKYFVVCFSTTKILPPRKIPTNRIYRRENVWCLCFHNVVKLLVLLYSLRARTCRPPET